MIPARPIVASIVDLVPVSEWAFAGLAEDKAGAQDGGGAADAVFGRAHAAAGGTGRPHSLTAAAAQFAMSPREAQVLALLLDGAQIPEVGERLAITPSTVQDHIKSLLHKTASKNRSQMIAKVLGWGRS
jgi:DNA-binding CsgD family transcriptional regulator